MVKLIKYLNITIHISNKKGHYYRYYRRSNGTNILQQHYINKFENLFDLKKCLQNITYHIDLGINRKPEHSRYNIV